MLEVPANWLELSTWKPIGLAEARGYEGVILANAAPICQDIGSPHMRSSAQRSCDIVGNADKVQRSCDGLDISFRRSLHVRRMPPANTVDQLPTSPSAKPEGDAGTIQEIHDDVELERAELRRIQFLIVLLSCLPRDGKCREVMELALALDEGPQIARLTGAHDLGTNDGLRLWLESLWAREDLSPEERAVVWWQNDGPNMDAAIRELKAVEAGLGATWTIAPSASPRVEVPPPG
jgi:hypothetical protein